MHLVNWAGERPLASVRLSIAAFCLALPLAACVPPGPGATSNEGGETTQSSSESGGDEIWMEFADGCVVDPYIDISESTQMTMVLGGQGLLMFPLHLRAGGFDLPDDYGPADPQAPRLDLEVRVDGYNNGPNDTFARIANYPVLFSADESSPQTWDFRYLTVFVPDEVSGGNNPEPVVVDGLNAHVNYNFEVPGHPPLVGSFDAALYVPQPFEPEASCGF